MKRFIIIVLAVLVVMVVVSVAVVRHLYQDNQRLRANQRALTESITLYRTRDSLSAASVERLTLTIGELRQQHSVDVERIRSLGIRLRRVETLSSSATQHSVEAVLPLRDTIIMRDTLRIFTYDDRWTKLAGILYNDSLRYTLHSVDTLYQIVHRVPRKWWFLRFGTKAFRQEIVSSNPNTHLVYSEYIEVVR